MDFGVVLHYGLIDGDDQVRFSGSVSQKWKHLPL